LTRWADFVLSPESRSRNPAVCPDKEPRAPGGRRQKVPKTSGQGAPGSGEPGILIGAATHLGEKCFNFRLADYQRAAQRELF
jgi:hypothetical protein